MASSKKERDLFRWVKLPIEPLILEVPMWSVSALDRQLVWETTAFVLPSDLIQEICRRGLQEACFLGYGSIKDWWSKELDAVYMSQFDDVGPIQDMLPLLLHEDAVPFSQSQTCTFWSWSSPLSNQACEISRN